MPPARGDTKPCTEPGCTGVMQYARPPHTAAGLTADDALRWMCSGRAGHDRGADESRQLAADVAVPR